MGFLLPAGACTPNAWDHEVDVADARNNKTKDDVQEEGVENGREELIDEHGMGQREPPKLPIR